MRHVLGIVIVVSAVVGQARAQSVDKSALAEQLFNQARALAQANQWAEACPKFEASLHYDPTLGTRLNLATCYEHIGKLASAWALYRESVELARKAGDSKRRDYAQNQAVALEPRLAQLTISPPAKPPTGFVVARDGTQIDAGALGTALYVDSGLHEITASAPGFKSSTQTVTLVDGKAETLVIPDLEEAPAPPPGPPDPAKLPVGASVTKTEPLIPASPTRKYIALGTGAAGVAVVGIGLLFGAKANSSFKEAKSLCGENLVCNPTDFDKANGLMADARSSGTISTVLVVGGGAAMVAGTIMLLTAPRWRERATARIVPVTHDGGAGLAITGGF